MSIVHILIEYAEKYFTDGLVFPDKIKEESMNAMLDSDSFYQLLESRKIVINTNVDTPEFVTSKNELMNLVREEMENCTMNLNDLKDYMQRYGVKYDRFKQKDGIRGCFIGMKIT